MRLQLVLYLGPSAAREGSARWPPAVGAAGVGAQTAFMAAAADRANAARGPPRLSSNRAAGESSAA
nr:MAG: hypothetical protein TU36_00120 [Vulcanisaeta sp. AZ3]